MSSLGDTVEAGSPSASVVGSPVDRLCIRPCKLLLLSLKPLPGHQVGWVRFSCNKEYHCSEDWEADQDHHCVPKGSPYGWQQGAAPFSCSLNAITNERHHCGGNAACGMCYNCYFAAWRRGDNYDLWLGCPGSRAVAQPIANAGSDPNQTVTFYLAHASNADGAFFMKPVLIGTSIFDPQTLTIVYVMGLSASESEVPT